MKIILDEKYQFRKIEFCCGEMGNFVMRQFVQSYPHSNHYPIFYVTVTRTEDKERIYEHMLIKYCPFCGAKINCKIIVDKLGMVCYNVYK